MTFLALENVILKLHDFFRIFMTVETLPFLIIVSKK